MRIRGPLVWVCALVVVPGCGLDETGAASGASGGSPNGGGTGGVVSGGGGSGGVPTGGGGTKAGGGGAGTGASGGSGGTAGAGATGGSGGSAGVSSGGAAGAGGSVSDPCAGACTDIHATCAAGICKCASGYVDTDGNDKSATCVAGVKNVRVEVGIDHGRLGNLTIKLFSPSAKTITIMSRPGFTEAADDGSANGTVWTQFNYGTSGDQSDLVASNPVSFFDSAATSAEDMGKNQDGGGLAVCRDADTVSGASTSPICDYHSDPGAAKGPATFAAAFGGELPSGVWKLCVGDSDPGTSGTLRLWELQIETMETTLAPVTGAGLNLGIPEDAYNGSPASMVCSDLTVP